ncbi:MEDS domain-containing protein [Streptomyces sp. NPDC048172]|uniref:MEDS domain-containing protein n=1 Tax=Streptomyces sp. NPDC048172 TaxID=3365505 RepID=UPI00371FB7CD
MSDREAPGRTDVPGRPAAVAPDARTLPVQRIRPGQHAFTAYDSESTQWDVVGAFVRQGLALSEKVLLFLHPRITGDELLRRIGAGTPALTQAWERGQLALSTMRALIAPDQVFTAARQWDRITEESEHAVRQGYSAMRAYIDMAWVHDLGTDVRDVMRRERSSGHLFEGGRYSEVCAYDDRTFSSDVLHAMQQAHPVNLLGTVGSLHAVPASDGNGTGTSGGTAVRLVGEADIATHHDFTAALRAAYGRAEPGRPLLIDLRTLHFLSAGCAAELLRLSAAAGTTAHGRGATSRTTVRCTPVQARTLRRLGSDAVRSLTLVEEGNGC